MDSAESDKLEKINARQALLEAAETLFTSRGYAAVGTREVAEVAGVNLGAISYYFGSKSHLFVEVVRNVMRRRKEGDAASTIAHQVGSRDEAAVQLCRFIVTLMDDIFCPRGHEMCRILLREILSETSFDPQMREAIVSSAVDDFMRPVGENLRALLLQLDPMLRAEELDFFVNSVIGQCMYYFTHQPFLERLMGSDFQQAQQRRTVAAHVSRVTLRALGCPQELMQMALVKVFDDSQSYPAARGA